MWTVSAWSVTFCVSCERKPNPLSIPHWIPLICTDHALILRYRAASPSPSRNTPDWYLSARRWGWGVGGGVAGVVSHFPLFFFFFFYCQYVTWCHSPKTWGELSSCSRGRSQQQIQFHWSCSWLQSLLQIEKWTKKRRSVSATFPRSLHSICLRGGNSGVLEHSGSLG